MSAAMSAAILLEQHVGDHRRKRISRRPGAVASAATTMTASSTRRRRRSPPTLTTLLLPPKWGQDVAPPPTPFYTPHTSPGSAAAPGGGGPPGPARNTGGHHHHQVVEDKPPSVIGVTIDHIRENYEVEFSRGVPAAHLGQVDRHVDRPIRDPRQEMVTDYGFRHHQGQVEDDDVITYTYSFGSDGSIVRRPLYPAAAAMEPADPMTYHYYTYFRNEDEVDMEDHHRWQPLSPPGGATGGGGSSAGSSGGGGHGNVVKYHNPPNSQSSSPVWTSGSGNSPEAAAAACATSGGTRLGPSEPGSGSSPSEGHQGLATSPVIMSPRLYRQMSSRRHLVHQQQQQRHLRRHHRDLNNRYYSSRWQVGPPAAGSTSSLVLAAGGLTSSSSSRMIKSALKLPNANGVRKTVQWVSDFKRRPEDISSDRRVVKVQYSLDNEAERQKLELRAQKLQDEMVQRLGTPAECMDRRERRVQSLRRVEADIDQLLVHSRGDDDQHSVASGRASQGRRSQGGWSGARYSSSSSVVVGQQRSSSSIGRHLAVQSPSPSGGRFGGHRSMDDLSSSAMIGRDDEPPAMSWRVVGEATPGPSGYHVLSNSGPAAEGPLLHQSHFRPLQDGHPPHLVGALPSRRHHHQQQFQDDVSSVISFTSSVHSLNFDSGSSSYRGRPRGPPGGLQVQDDGDELAAEASESVGSLVSLLGCTDLEKMSRTFLAMSSSPANCDLMRNHRVVPLLVRLLHHYEVPGQNQARSDDLCAAFALEDEVRQSVEVRQRAARVLRNIVQAHPNERQRKREAKILRLIEVLRMYADFLRDLHLALLASSRDQGASEGSLEQNNLVNYLGSCNDIFVRSDGPSRPLCISVREETVATRVHQKVPDYLSGMAKEFTISGKNFVDFSAEGDRLLAGYCRDQGGGGGDPPPLMPSSSSEEAAVVRLNMEKTMAVLTRCSFNESHRQPIFLLGGIPAIADLVKVERLVHQPMRIAGGQQVGLRSKKSCSEVRRYALVALTNLTFGNAASKSFLCSFPGFISIMVNQLVEESSAPNENLLRATAHLFRNLSWKADKPSKQVLSDSSAVTVLMRSAMSVASKPAAAREDSTSTSSSSKEEEPTLKVILSAIWNLSSHCRKNKADICHVDGGLEFLVGLLRHKTVSIVENSGGILRNISGFIATSDEGDRYRTVLRRQGFLDMLLQQLKSPSLTVVSNACGTLWNISARNLEDRQALWDKGAVPMLQSLTNSKHNGISMCSLAALKNLYSGSNRPSSRVRDGAETPASSATSPGQQVLLQPAAPSLSSPGVSLDARKRKNLAKELDEKLTCSERLPGVEDEDDDDDDGRASEISSRNSSSCGSLEKDVAGRQGDTAVGDHGHQGGPDLAIRQRRRSRPPSSSSTSGEEEADDEPPTNYSLRFQETEETELMSGKPGKNSSDVVDTSTGEANDEGPPDKDGRDDVIKGDDENNGCRSYDDAVKTYCIEETPYDTPFMVSTAGSMTNLSTREDLKEDLDEDDAVKDRTKKPLPMMDDDDDDDLFDTIVDEDEERPRNFAAVEEAEPISPRNAEEVSSSSSGGLDTPLSEGRGEGPKVYCTEDTPGVFSRADSISSLESNDDPDDQDNIRNQVAAFRQQHRAFFVEEDDDEAGGIGGQEKGQMEANNISGTKECLLGHRVLRHEEDDDQVVVDKDNKDDDGLGGGDDHQPPGRRPEGDRWPKPQQQQRSSPPSRAAGGAKQSGNHNPVCKQVTFHPHETPLMFSRASSLESLNSFEQHSVKDGYSSCDFSRATSGRVSPSDLPDSPCQSRPRTPPPLAQPRSSSSAVCRGDDVEKALLGSKDTRPKAVTTDETVRKPPTLVVVGHHHHHYDQALRQQPFHGGKARFMAPPSSAKAVSTGGATSTSANGSAGQGGGKGVGSLGEGGLEEAVKVYRDEGSTPACFSGRTSLSKLSFSNDDDEDEGARDDVGGLVFVKRPFGAGAVKTIAIVQENDGSDTVKAGTFAGTCDGSQSAGEGPSSLIAVDVDDEDEDGDDDDEQEDEDIYSDALIARLQTSGMPMKSLGKESRLRISGGKHLRSGIPVVKAPPTKGGGSGAARGASARTLFPDLSAEEENVKRYNTEDTPVSLSQVGSNTNLSQLTFDDGGENLRRHRHPSSSSSSGDNDDAVEQLLLDQCVRVAWASNTTISSNHRFKHQVPPNQQTRSSASLKQQQNPNRQPQTNVSRASSTSATSSLGVRIEGEGAPSTTSSSTKPSTTTSKAVAGGGRSHRHGQGLVCSAATGEPFPQPSTSSGWKGSNSISPRSKSTAYVKPSPRYSAHGTKPPTPPKREGSALTYGPPTSCRQTVPDLVQVYAVEGTPRNFSNATSLSDLTVEDPPASGRISVDSNDGLMQHHINARVQGRASASTFRLRNAEGQQGVVDRSSRSQPGTVNPSARETPLHFATEDTPVNFSRADSLSSLSCAGESDEAAEARFGVDSKRGDNLGIDDRALSEEGLPRRPQAIGRSESSGSSKSGTGRSANSTPAAKSKETGENGDVRNTSGTATSGGDSEDDENLLASCVNSGMPKSRSEPLNLEKILPAKKRKKVPIAEAAISPRPNLKSPRSSSSSKLVPGVRMAELKLTHPGSSRPSPSQSPKVDWGASDKDTEEAIDADQRVSSDLGLKPNNGGGEMEVNGNVWTNDGSNRIEGAASEKGGLKIDDYLEESSSQHVGVGQFQSEEADDDDKDELAVVPNNYVTSLEEDSSAIMSASRIIELEANRVAQSVFESEPLSLASSLCSTISAIQPPSMMEGSLLSLTGGQVPMMTAMKDPAGLIHQAHINNSPKKSTAALWECRHSAKVRGRLTSHHQGSTIPETVRRALFGSLTSSVGPMDDLTSSISSCQSNLDNIKPPTLMFEAEMDNSFLSIASISSEIFDHQQLPAFGSGSRMVIPGDGANSFDDVLIDDDDDDVTKLEDIGPPSNIDDILTSSRTLVAPKVDNLCGNNGAAVDRVGKLGHMPAETCETYSLEPNVSTCQDITDIFDEDAALDHTTLGSDQVYEDEDEDVAPDLPRDGSSTATPAQSGGESSAETTPSASRRRLRVVRRPSRTEKAGSGQRDLSSTSSLFQRELEMENLRSYKALIPSLEMTMDEPALPTDNVSLATTTSGYRSTTGIVDFPSSSMSSKSDGIETELDLLNRQHRDSGKLGTVDELGFLEEGARLVVDAINIGKANARSRSVSTDRLLSGDDDDGSSDDSSRSCRRSSSVDILDEDTLRQEELQVVGSYDSILSARSSSIEPRSSPAINEDTRPEQLSDDEAAAPVSPKGPRICKPHPEGPSAPPAGIRGRRKLLYSSPSLRGQQEDSKPSGVEVGAATGKPTIAPKPKQFLSSTGILRLPPTAPAVPPTPTTSQTSAQSKDGGSRTAGTAAPCPSPRKSVPTTTPCQRKPSSGGCWADDEARPISEAEPTIAAEEANHRHNPPLPLVRQGTFTKDESSSSLSVLALPVVDDLLGPMIPAAQSRGPTSDGKMVVGCSSSKPDASRPSRPQSTNSSIPVSSKVSSSPRSVAGGSLSSLHDDQKAGTSSHQVRLGSGRIGVAQTKTSAMRERSNSRSSGTSVLPDVTSHGSPAPSSTSSMSQTKLQRNTSVSSTASSVASSRSSRSSLGGAAGMRPSSSIQGLKTVAEDGAPFASTGSQQILAKARRTPSSSDIELGATRRSTGTFGTSAGSRIQLQGQGGAGGEDATPGMTQDDKKRPGGKVVASRIASLWRKVEDSKMKSATGKNPVGVADKRIWIGKGKVIPEAERALLRPHSEQKQIIESFQAAKEAAAAKTTSSPSPSLNSTGGPVNSSSRSSTSSLMSTPSSSAKTPSSSSSSRSRLSIKLSRFSRSSSASSSKKASSSTSSGTKVATDEFSMQPQPGDSSPRVDCSGESRKTGSRSRGPGSLFDPKVGDEECPVEAPASLAIDGGGHGLHAENDRPRSSLASSGRATSAIVQPFNYSGIIHSKVDQFLNPNDVVMRKNITSAANAAKSTQRMMPRMLSHGAAGTTTPQQVPSFHEVGLPTRASNGMKQFSSTSTVRRNDSYNTSMGRAKEEAAKSREAASKGLPGASSSAKDPSSGSVMITLV